jgi:serine/threonine protein kinase
MGNSGSFGCFFCLSDESNQGLLQIIESKLKNGTYKLMKCQEILISETKRYIPNEVLCDNSDIQQILKLLKGTNCIKITKHFNSYNWLHDESELADTFAFEIHNLKLAYPILQPIFPFHNINGYWGFKIVFAEDDDVKEGYNKLPSKRKYWYFIISPKCTPMTSLKGTSVDISELYNNLTGDLKKLHSAGYIHGDIKPQNVVCCDNRYMFIDYGGMRHTQNFDSSRAIIKTESFTLPTLRFGCLSPFNVDDKVLNSIHNSVCKYILKHEFSKIFDVNIYMKHDEYGVFLVLLKYLHKQYYDNLSTCVKEERVPIDNTIISSMIKLIHKDYLGGEIFDKSKNGGSKNRISVLYKGKKYIRTIQINKRGTPVVKIDGEFKPLGRLKTI